MGGWMIALFVVGCWLDWLYSMLAVAVAVAVAAAGAARRRSFARRRRRRRRALDRRRRGYEAFIVVTSNPRNTTIPVPILRHPSPRSFVFVFFVFRASSEFRVQPAPSLITLRPRRRRRRPTDDNYLLARHTSRYSNSSEYIVHTRIARKTRPRPPTVLRSRGLPCCRTTIAKIRYRPERI